MISIHPECPDFYMFRGECYSRLKNSDAAKAELLKVLIFNKV